MLNKLTTLINGDLIKTKFIVKEVSIISIIFSSLIYKTVRVSLFIRLNPKIQKILSLIKGIEL